MSQNEQQPADTGEPIAYMANNRVAGGLGATGLANRPLQYR